MAKDRKTLTVTLSLDDVEEVIECEIRGSRLVVKDGDSVILEDLAEGQKLHRFIESANSHAYGNMSIYGSVKLTLEYTNPSVNNKSNRD